VPALSSIPTDLEHDDKSVFKNELSEYGCSTATEDIVAQFRFAVRIDPRSLRAMVSASTTWALVEIVIPILA